MFLVGADVIRELGNGERCDPRVAGWYAGVGDDDLYLSVLVTGQIRTAIESIRDRDRQRAVALERWLHEVERSFGERILPVDARVADTWGKMSAIGTAGVIDSLLAATAMTYDLTLVTCAAPGVGALGAEVLNPFTAGPPSHGPGGL